MVCMYYSVHFIDRAKHINKEGTRDAIGKVQPVQNEAYGVPTEMMNIQENVAYSSAQPFTEAPIPPASPHVYEVVNANIVESEDGSRSTKVHYDYIEII